MNAETNRRILRRMLGLAVLALPLALCGCESEDTDKDITATRFSLDRELFNYTDTDEYTWDTTLDQAIVTLRIDDFTEGDTSIRVYDGAGKIVLIATLNTLDSVYFNGDDMFFQRATDPGTPGRWTVVLGYEDFTGNYDLTIE